MAQSLPVDVADVSPMAWRLLRTAAGYEQRGVERALDDVIPVATPPNAIVFGSGHLKQEHMMKTGVALNIVMTAILTGLIWVLFQYVWPMFLW